MPNEEYSLTVANDEYDLTVVNGTELTLTLSGPAGPAGATGAAGPNSVTSATTSDGTANLSVATVTATSNLNVGNGNLVVANNGNTTLIGTISALSATFIGTSRPTSSGTGTPGPTSLITAADLASSTFVSVRDEFIGGGTAGNVIGELGWQRFISPSSAAAGGNVILASGTLPHIGLRTQDRKSVV